MTFCLFPSSFLSKEIHPLGPCFCLCTAHPWWVDPAGPQTEGNNKQEGVPGSRAGGLHRQPARQGHGRNPQHPPSSGSGRQEGREDVNGQRTTLRLFCEFVFTSSWGQGLCVPDNQPQAPSHHLSPLHVIWQESVLPIEARFLITVSLLLYVPRVLFLNATVPYVVYILCPERHGHKIWSWPRESNGARGIHVF